MDSEKLREYGPRVLEQVAKYWDGLRDRQPRPEVKPGSIIKKFPKEPPMQPESWDDIIGDLETHILSGNTHWHHPHFFAYFPASCSYPSVLADMLSTGIGCIGFTWHSSPSCTEVEIVMLDWLVKALGLPEHFLYSHPGPGGGIIQPTASDSTLVAVLAARSQMMHKKEAERQALIHEREQKIKSRANNLLGSIQKKVYELIDYTTPKTATTRLMMYCNNQAHCSVERAGLLANVNVHKVEPGNDMGMGAEQVQKAIEEDVKKGYVPFCIIATIGTTNSCAFDKIEELGILSQKLGLWLHVDSAYAGCALVCPEFRYLVKGIEYVDSFNFNPHKWLRISFDCSPMWFKDRYKVEDGFKVDPLYLKHDEEGEMPDFRHMQIALGRRFRSLKIWFVLRALGIEGLREHIRSMVKLAKEFESYLVNDPDNHFEIVNSVLGLVCFRIRNHPNATSEKLMAKLNQDGRIHLVPGCHRGVYYLRLAICSALTTSDDVRFAFDVIKECLSQVLL